MTSRQLSERPAPLSAESTSRASRQAPEDSGGGGNSPAASNMSQSERGSPGHQLLRVEEWRHAARALHLSGRELEIARAIFEDRTESVIAKDLGISPHTVHTHVERLYRKLAVASRTQLVLRVIQTGIGRDGPR